MTGFLLTAKQKLMLCINKRLYSDDWYRFTFLSDAWLPDYCLYMAIKEENKMCDWQTWPAPLRLRDPKALEEFRTGHADELGFWAFVQYEFAKQWQALKAYANSKGIKIMGDIPIYVAADSADAWAGVSAGTGSISR